MTRKNEAFFLVSLGLNRVIESYAMRAFLWI